MYSFTRQTHINYFHRDPSCIVFNLVPYQSRKFKNGKNQWFLNSTFLEMDNLDIHFFFMKHKTWSLSRGTFLVSMNFLYEISLFHYFANWYKLVSWMWTSWLGHLKVLRESNILMVYNKISHQHSLIVLVPMLYV